MALTHSLTLSSATRKLSPPRWTHLLSWDIPCCQRWLSQTCFRRFQWKRPVVTPDGCATPSQRSALDHGVVIQITRAIYWAPTLCQALNRTPRTCHFTHPPSDTVCCPGGRWGSEWSHLHPGYMVSDWAVLTQCSTSLPRAKSRLTCCMPLKSPLSFPCLYSFTSCFSEDITES